MSKQACIFEYCMDEDVYMRNIIVRVTFLYCNSFPLIDSAYLGVSSPISELS